MKDLVSGIIGHMYIQTQVEYTGFTKTLSRQPKMKKKVFLRLANVEKDEKKEEILELEG